jgi:hypothetical protein
MAVFSKSRITLAALAAWAAMSADHLSNEQDDVNEQAVIQRVFDEEIQRTSYDKMERVLSNEIEAAFMHAMMEQAINLMVPLIQSKLSRQLTRESNDRNWTFDINEDLTFVLPTSQYREYVKPAFDTAGPGVGPQTSSVPSMALFNLDDLPPEPATAVMRPFSVVSPYSFVP